MVTKLFKFNRFKKPFLYLGLALGLAFTQAPPLHAQSSIILTGDMVASISQTFLENHYSHSDFNDSSSSKMLHQYVNRFDSGRFYFLASDIKEFQKFSTQLDELLPDGEIEVAFRIFDRFKQRMGERFNDIPALLKRINLKKNDSRLLERKNAPFAKNKKDAKRLWKKKLKFELLGLTLDGKSRKKAEKRLIRRYRSALLRFQQFNHNDVVTAFLNAFTATYDPHSSYMSPDDLENFNITLSLSLEGIGATLRWDDGETVISSLIPGGAAFREGSLKAEDRIMAVAQGKSPFDDVRDMRLGDVVKLIRGKRGTLVRLAILRHADGGVDTRTEVSIIRDKIVLKDGEAKGEIKKLTRKKKVLKLGVINLPSFYVDFSRRHSNPKNYKSSSRDVGVILKKFNAQNVNGVILDLRNNGGGGLDEAVSLAGHFLGPGPVVEVKDMKGRIEYKYNPHSKTLYNGPLMVLTNRYSASASEIVAGALVDYSRALVVGDRSTFGKGTVQNIIYLSQGQGALKTTVAKFYRPGSSSTQNKGVEPHIVLPSLTNHLDVGESALENALPWDSIPLRKHIRPWGDFTAFIPTLKAKSKYRIKRNSDFREVKKSIKGYLEKKKRNSISIREIIQENKILKKKKKSAKPPHKTRGKAKQKDVYLQEALEILGDFIELKPKSALKVASQKKVS